MTPKAARRMVIRRSVTIRKDMNGLLEGYIGIRGLTERGIIGLAWIASIAVEEVTGRTGRELIPTKITTSMTMRTGMPTLITTMMAIIMADGKITTMVVKTTMTAIITGTSTSPRNTPQTETQLHRAPLLPRLPYQKLSKTATSRSQS